MFLVILVIYSAWISPFDFAFLDNKEGALRIFDNIVNGFFAIDIILTFFVAYLDSQSYVLIDDHKKIAARSAASSKQQFKDIVKFQCIYYYWKIKLISHCFRYLSTWFIFDVSSTVPFRSLSLLCTDRKGEIGFKILSMLRLWRLRRVSSLFARYIHIHIQNIIIFKILHYKDVKKDTQKYTTWQNPHATIQAREGHQVQLFLDPLYEAHLSKPPNLFSISF